MKLLISIIVLSVSGFTAYSQGCVAIRNTGICSPLSPQQQTKGWQLNLSYRYFKSFRHFVGKVEQHEREEAKTEVVNWQHGLNLTLVRHLNDRWSLQFDVPLVANKRSSLYEHGGNNGGDSARHNTSSFGVGDARVSVYRWMFPHTGKGNLQIGVGIKFPTGDYKYQDFFIKSDGSRVLGPVDQSIQPGDGGTGFTAELNGFFQIARWLGSYGSAYYLINPREHNGTSTARGGTPSQTSLQYNFSTMSVPDQMMIRAGLSIIRGQFHGTMGFRWEAIPAEDLIGGNGGFRRPGYVLSVEPGLTFSTSKVTLFCTVPVAVERNRWQSYTDKLRTIGTGTYTHGDAAFADYVINLGASFKL